MTNCRVENTIPVLAVADVRASVSFYRDLLGFELEWAGEGDTPQIAAIMRDGHSIMLQRRDPVLPGWVWIGVSEIASLWDRIRSRPEIVVVEPPTNQPWALEMRIADSDGNVLWFGTDPLLEVPFGAEVDVRHLHSE